MTIHSEIILRYRAEGHLRFSVPAALCTASAAPALEQALHSIDGVYRVLLYRNHRKLSIRFFDTVTDAPKVAREMLRIINKLVAEGLHIPRDRAARRTRLKKTMRVPLVQRLGKNPVGKWVKKKYVEGKETLTALKVLAKRTAKNKNAPSLLQNPERALMEFANDILVLYLVKIHWQRILHEWLPNPLKYRYQWLAVTYLTYLWVRWRHNKD
jgi:hypothetical protein